jgi:hypothetical protein
MGETHHASILRKLAVRQPHQKNTLPQKLSRVDHLLSISYAGPISVQSMGFTHPALAYP